MSTKLLAVSSINCNGCSANAHSSFEQNEKIHVVGNCGDKQTLGGCFGVVLYPIKNPSMSAHLKLCRAVKQHAERRAEWRPFDKPKKTHIIGLHEHDLSASHTLDSAAA